MVTLEELQKRNNTNNVSSIGGLIGYTDDGKQIRAKNNVQAPIVNPVSSVQQPMATLEEGKKRNNTNNVSSIGELIGYTDDGKQIRAKNNVQAPIVNPVSSVQQPIQPVSNTNNQFPQQSTTDTTGRYTVPEPVKIDPSFISFGDEARQRNEQDQTYLTNRNNMLAQGFAGQNIVNEQDILSNLQKIGNFSQQPIEDQQNTAKSIASMIQESLQQPGQEQPGVEQPGQQPYTTEEMIDAATENTIIDEQQKFLQDVYRSGTIYDRNVEDLQEQNRLIKENLDAKLEKTKTGIERQIEDVQIQTERSVAGYDMVGALKGLNRSSGFISGIQNIREDANRTINRLQQDLDTYTTATGEAKDEAMKQLATNMKRAKEDFDYAMRDVMQLAQIDMNTIVDKYGLSSEKMQNKLDSITLDVLQKRENLLGTYINNTRNTIASVNDQLSLIEAQDAFVGQQRDRFTSILEANDGAALSTMTPEMIQEYVNQGYLAPEQGAAYFELMKGKSIATLQANGKPTNEDMSRVTSLIDSGMTPAEAVAKVMQDNPDRYEAGAEWSPLSGGGGVLWRVGADGNPEFITGPGFEQPGTSTTTGTTTGTTTTQGPTPSVDYTPVESDTLQLSAEQWASNYPDGSYGGQCGEFVNEYLKSAGVATSNLFLDPITQKETLSNSDTPTVGSIAIMDSPTYPQYGHVGIVTKVNEDGSFEIQDSNWVAEETIWTRTMQPGDATYGFFDPSIEGTEFSPVEIKAFMDLEDMTGYQRNNALNDDPALKKRYENYISTIEEKEQKYATEAAIYNSSLKLGIGVSDEDREFIMYEYNQGIMNDDPNMIDNAIRQGVVVKNEDNKGVYDTFTTTMDALNMISDGVSSYDGKTNIFKGGLEKISQKIGATSDPALANIKSGIDIILANYLRDISGTAASDNEREFIRGMLPSIRNAGNLNDILSDNFLKMMKVNAERPVRNTIGRKGDEGRDKIWERVFAPQFDLQKDESGYYITGERGQSPQSTAPTPQDDEYIKNILFGG